MTDETQPNLPAKVEAKKAELVTGGTVSAIIPRTIEEVFRLAGAIYGSGLAPSTYKGPDQVMVAILSGAEVGFPPMQSLQSIAVINGRPTMWGDGLMAVVRNQGFQVTEWTEGDGESMVAFCEVTRPDTGEVIQRKFSVADAKLAGLWGKRGRDGQPTPWVTYPARMLQMRARSWAIRDGAADVTRGFQVREEVEDYTRGGRDVTPQKSGLADRLRKRGFNADNVEAGINGEDVKPDDEVSPVADQVAAVVTAMRQSVTRADLEVAKLDGEHISGANPEERAWMAETYEQRMREFGSVTIVNEIEPDPATAAQSGAAEQTQVEDADFTDSNATGPSETAETKPADPTPAEEEMPSVDDLVDWASSYLRGLTHLTEIGDIEHSWHSPAVQQRAKWLKKVKPAMASALVKAVNDRVAELRRK